ncbi:helix-turn-helix domain-containing protein [Bacillus sp. BGMRC 2118]|nr:helix-turn-helix domain-containing protein [Bacillus sp. BGMRC 2118]
MKRFWTSHEINILKDNVGTLKISTLARKLNRSEQSVLLKMKRLGIANTKEQNGLLTVGRLASILKVDRNTVCCWIRNHGLKCIKKVSRSKKAFWFIENSDFWNWAEQNKQRINFSKVEIHAIPPEPKWVEVERGISKSVRNYKIWTKREEIVLIELITKGKTYQEVAAELNRTSISIERKYNRLISYK